MVGLEIHTNSKLTQLTDKLETMCVLKKLEPSEITTSSGPYDEYPRIYALSGQWLVSPISKVEIPKTGVGLEVYDENGNVKFSSLAKLVSFEKYYDVNMNNAGKGKLQISGKPGHRYGMIQTRAMGYTHNKNIKSYIDPLTWDEVWEFDIYQEHYTVVDDIGGLTFEYKYEYIGYVDGYTDRPPDREGSGLMQQGLMIDVSMLE